MAIQSQLLVAVVALLGISALATPQAPDGQLEALISQLASSDAEVREKAYQKLVELGEEAREAVEAEIEARAAVAEVLKQIEINRVASPTTLTLDLNNSTLDEALDEVRRQTGYTLSPDDPQVWQQAAFGRVSVSVKEAPFWPTMREICMQAGVVIGRSASFGPQLTLAPAAEADNREQLVHPVSYDRSFMISFYESEAFELREPTPEGIRRGGHIRLQIAAEPKIRMMRHGQIKLEEAVDERGNSLIPVRSGRSGLVETRTADGRLINRSGTALPVPPIAGMNQRWIVTAWMHYPDDAGSRLARIRGSFPVVVQSRTKVLEFKDILSARNVSHTVGDYRYVLGELRKISASEYEADVEAHLREAPPADHGWNWQDPWLELMMHRPTARLVDADGREFAAPRVNRSGIGRGHVTSRMTFARPEGVGEPVLLIWEVPEETRQFDVNFEFTDLPLP